MQHFENETTSSSLLQGLKANDSTAWHRLANTYGPLVYAWCRKSGLAGSDVGDVAQEVFRVKGISLLDIPQVNAAELAEIEVMAGSPYLEGIDFSGTWLTDAAIEKLKAFTLLKTLDLRRTKITAAGVEELRKALPRCQIQWGDPP